MHLRAEQKQLAKEFINAMEPPPMTVTSSSATDDDVPPPTKKFKGSDMLRAYLADSSDEDEDSRQPQLQQRRCQLRSRAMTAVRSSTTPRSQLTFGSRLNLSTRC